MDRNAALDYVANEYKKPADDLGILQTDTSAGWKSVIDAAFLSIGTEYTGLQTATFSDTADTAFGDPLPVVFIALLNYYAIRRLLRAASTRVDITTGQPIEGAVRSQLFKQLKALLDDAQAELIQYGFGNVPQIIAGRLNLDFLEPFLELT